MKIFYWLVNIVGLIVLVVHCVTVSYISVITINIQLPLKPMVLYKLTHKKWVAYWDDY